MKKNKKATAILSLVILCGLAACGNATQEAAVVEVTADAPVNEETEEAVKTDVMIYYGNGASDNLDMEMVAVEQVTADNLIDALAKHNIVSIGTKVNSFDEEENNGVTNVRRRLISLLSSSDIAGDVYEIMGIYENINKLRFADLLTLTKCFSLRKFELVIIVFLIICGQQREKF